MGPANAKVVVQEVADFQCPYCGQFATSPALQLIDQYAQAGKIRFEYHHFVVIDGHTGGQESRRAAEASECANQQGQFWTFYDYLFHHQNGEGQGAFSDANLKSFALTLNLDATKFNACFDGKNTAKTVQQDEALAVSLGINQTPTVLINGKPVPDPVDTTQLQQMLDAALAQ
jgi:protein-disulfide isomerase